MPAPLCQLIPEQKVSSDTLASTLQAMHKAASMRSEMSSRQRKGLILERLFPGDVARQKDFAGWIPDDIPPGVDLVANAARARQMSNWEFYTAVRNKGEWDFKQLGSQYQDFGNWHFGAMAYFNGFSREVAQAGAGAAQIRAGTSRPEWGTPLTGFPYGDDLKDQAYIIVGWTFASSEFENRRSNGYFLINPMR